MYNTKLFSQAQRYFPGGVNSPVRSFNGINHDPIFMQSAKGAYLTDVDDKQYIDYVCSWGANILGHADPDLTSSLQSQLEYGIGYGTPTILETDLASKICFAMPSIEKIRFVSSGTEASMTAVRLARGYTKRKIIIKFNGCYHGHVDCLLVAAGSGVATHHLASSDGIPSEVIANTISLPFNDIEAVEQIFALHGGDIAAVIVEPIAGNMNCIPATTEFITSLKQACTAHDSVLIFDEVMTGFRVALGGAQSLYKITPDLTTLGKVIGGGLPVGAVGGKEKIMGCLAPLGSVYQAGTLSGNPLAMRAGIAVLNVLDDTSYVQLNTMTNKLTQGICNIAKDLDIKVYTQHRGGMFGILFTDQQDIKQYEDIQKESISFTNFFTDMLTSGVYLAPSIFESGFVSLAHTLEDIEITLDKMQHYLARL